MPHFYLWDTQDDKSEQDYITECISTLFTFRGECIKSVAMINVFVVVAHSPQTIAWYFFTVIATVNWILQLD